LRGTYASLRKDEYTLHILYHTKNQKNELKVVNKKEQKSWETTMTSIDETMHVGSNEYSIEVLSGKDILASFQFSLENNVKAIEL
jgi:CRISPR/Cas system CMR subunit Cmr6 (Cas7 group RAMP superfamily)